MQTKMEATSRLTTYSAYRKNKRNVGMHFPNCAAIKMYITLNYTH